MKRVPKKRKGLRTGTAVNRMIVADIHWKFIWFPLAVLGSLRIGEEKSQATSFHVLFQVNCSALRSHPRTDSTQCLLTLSSTRSHAHKTVQCLPFTACSDLLALCHTTTRVGHSRVLYCCLSYRVSLSVCTVCAAAPSPPSPSHCCTCLTTTVSHC